MRKAVLVVAVYALVCLPGYSQQEQQSHFDGQTWWNYVKVLAADNMEGRETGSPGLKSAEAYVVNQLLNSGLEPAGTQGFYQPIKFESREIVEKDSSLALVRNGKVEPLTLGDDAIFGTRIDLAPSAEGQLVFVGYGLTVPEKNYDDLAGLDLKGKIAVVFAGSPEEIPGALSSHYQSAGERWKSFQRAGALGIVTILNPGSMDIPWSRISINRTHPSMALVGQEFEETASQRLAVTVNPEKAEKFFQGSSHSFSEILAIAKDRRQLPRFPLAVSLRAKARMAKKIVESSNIVARLSGSDPALKDQYVVLSAHIDHIGIGEPINGDRIYNGAMDNGSGSAVLLDVAASLRKSPERLRRSLLFVFVTAEEKGLLGSKYFTAHPTVKPASMIANINIDMFLPIIPLKVLRVLGLTDSDMGDMARDVAQSLGVQATPDPEPQRNSFIRSDQYNFIRRGIPALAMSVSYAKDSPEQKIFKDWLTRRYHAPSDDLDQPVDLPAAAKYEELIRAMMVRLANNDQRPQWKQDSFFRRYAEPNSGQ